MNFDVTPATDACSHAYFEIQTVAVVPAGRLFQGEKP